MIDKAPPQFGQCSRSISNTRLSNRAQLMCAGAEGWGVSTGSGVPAFVSVAALLRDNGGTKLGVRCEYAVEPDKVESWTRKQRDANWPDWYAEYMVREQTGEELPQ